MKHFSIGQWADFVRDLGEPFPVAAMKAHLSSGCRRCEQAVSALRDVAMTARSDADYQPPEQAIRHAHAIFSLHQPEKVSFPRMVARLVHDSLRAPLPVGLRSQDRLGRHALYQAGSYYLDVQLEHQPRSGLVSLIGQIANRDEPATMTADLPVWLMERNGVVAGALCNSFGEFQLDYAPARDLRLEVLLPQTKRRLHVSLNRLSPEPLDQPTKVRRRQNRRGPSGG